MRFGLSTRFIFFISVLLTVAFVASGVLIMQLEKRFMASQFSQRADALGNFVAKIAPESILSFDVVQLEHFAEMLMGQPDLILAAIVDRSGAPLAIHLNESLPRPLHFKFRGSLFESATFKNLIAFYKNHPQAIYFSYPIRHQYNLLGEVLIILDSSSQREVQHKIFLQRIIVAIGVILLVVLSLYLGFKRYILSPILDLVEGANRMAHGNYKEPIPRTTKAELDTLTVAVNHMMLSIRTNTEEYAKIFRAVEQSPASVVITDAQGNIEYVNPKFCQLTGYSAQEVLGKNPRLLKSGEMSPNFYRDLWHTVTTGLEWHGEFYNRAQNGSLFWEAASISAIRSEQGKITHFVAVKDDITARKKLERELQQARDRAESSNRAKSEFLALMSHEIRTPMNAILGMSELLAESNLSGEQRELLTVQRRAALALLDLINDILDLSRVESGRLELDHAPMHLPDFFIEIQDLFRQQAIKKNLAFSITLEDDLPKTYFADRARLRQVMINLVGNAIKFTQQGGVWISVERLSQQGEMVKLKFSVVDSGCGIPSEAQSQIFEPFTQADAYVTRHHGGTGLGLTISQRLVQLFGGTLQVESTPNQGSRFSFILILQVTTEERSTQPNTQAQTTPEPNTAPSSGAPNARILLAEDMPDNALLIKRFLKNYPCELTLVTDGRQAVEQFCRTTAHFDLVLMDMQMPVLDGYSAVREIREYEAIHDLAPTPILALTAHALKNDAEKSLAAGCDEHLTKPIRKEVLLAAISRHLSLAKHDKPQQHVINDILPAPSRMPQEPDPSAL
ncbi:PAS/PAC sensor hybrid histidine kinase [Magnetococcus marinus MC-1]|uniref:Sensory/regulatory protein RpfC n=1 Tax=Magnetococcus marinus (strain ATCC BAA-1437 / JCM 17883 / MC-1) TaxID=156889 RepID=A0L8Z4_MAGMM|nr:ATP-binding protein [Magnetococcus marinus]ABK44437.1 PAS/PAC sensor hybrid histidine kinase [Magnetococcus marinus MC-1]